MKLEFSRIPEIMKYQISRKSVHWELSCYMWTDGQRHTQTDRHEEPISRFFTILRKRRKTNKEIGKYILHPYIGKLDTGNYCVSVMTQVLLYRCTVNLDNVKFPLPTNAPFIKHIKC